MWLFTPEPVLWFYYFILSFFKNYSVSGDWTSIFICWYICISWSYKLRASRQTWGHVSIKHLLCDAHFWDPDSFAYILDNLHLATESKQWTGIMRSTKGKTIQWAVFVSNFANIRRKAMRRWREFIGKGLLNAAISNQCPACFWQILIGGVKQAWENSPEKPFVSEFVRLPLCLACTHRAIRTIFRGRLVMHAFIYALKFVLILSLCGCIFGVNARSYID